MTELNSSKSHRALSIHERSNSESEEVLNSTQEARLFPEGGIKAWLTVAGASACLFVSFGWINCVGVFEEYYLTHQLSQYTPSKVAWIPALQSR